MGKPIMQFESSELLQVMWLVENNITKLNEELNCKLMYRDEVNDMSIKILKRRIERNKNILDKISKYFGE